MKGFLVIVVFLMQKSARTPGARGLDALAPRV